MVPPLLSQRKDARGSNLSELERAESLYHDTLMQCGPPESQEVAPSSNHRERTPFPLSAGAGRHVGRGHDSTFISLKETISQLPLNTPKCPLRSLQVLMCLPKCLAQAQGRIRIL